MGSYWQGRVTKAYSKEANNITCREICNEIIHTLRLQQPTCRVQADLLRLRKAEGRSARCQYGHIKAIAEYADLESLKPEQLHILLTLNSLDPKDYRMRDKMLEAVGDKG